jgi:hypothetical protein
MGLLKRKDERSEAIAIRVPASLKAELEELRRRADEAGFDLTATITEALTRLARQVRGELDGAAVKPNAASRVAKANGVSVAALPNGGAA